MRHRNRHPYFGRDHVHAPKRAEPSTEIEERCPRCGELLPEDHLKANCLCPWCGVRACEGAV